MSSGPGKARSRSECSPAPAREPIRHTKRDAAIGAAAGAVIGAVSSRDKVKGGLIGAALGCGAHLVSLRRIATGPFRVEECVTLDELESLSEGERLARLRPVEALLPGHVRVALGAEDAARFLSDMRRRGPWGDAPRC